jgi:hypothetical protein
MATSWTNPEFTTQVTVTEGKISATFDVEVETAQEESWHDVARGNVQAWSPAIQVTTFTSYDTFRPIVVRGRDYGVDVVFVKQARPQQGSEFWHSRDHFEKGLINDNKLPVERISATGRLLTELAAKARDQYVREHPEWEIVSLRRALTGKRDKERREAEELRRQADKHDVAAAEWAAKIEALPAS